MKPLVVQEISGPPTKVKKMKSPFQKELDAKLRERRKRGLCIDLDDEEDDEEFPDENDLTAPVNPLEEDLESQMNPVNMEMNPKHKISVDSRYMQLLDELVNGDDIEESPTSPQKLYCDDSEEENSEAETVVQMSPPVPLPRRKILEDFSKEDFKESSQKNILHNDISLLQSCHEDSPHELLGDITADDILSKISTDLENLESKVESLPFFYPSHQYENAADNKSLNTITFTTDSILDSLNFNTVSVETTKVDNAEVDFHKEFEEFNLLSLTNKCDVLDKKTVSEMQEKHIIDLENNKISAKETVVFDMENNQIFEKGKQAIVDRENNQIYETNEVSFVEALIDFGLDDDVNGNVLSTSDSSYSMEHSESEVEKTILHSDKEGETNDLLHSKDLDQQISSLPNNVHISLSLPDTYENSELHKTDDKPTKASLSKMKVSDLFTKVLLKKKESEQSLKSIESPKLSQIASTVSYKKLLENVISSSPHKNEVLDGQCTKNSGFVKKVSDYSNALEKHNQKINNLITKEILNHKEAEMNLKSEITKQAEPHLKKKKNEISHRIQSRDRSQSPKIGQSNHSLVKVPIVKETQVYETRRVHSAGSERKVPNISRLQKSANSSPARNKSCEPEDASAVKKAAFDEWCQKKIYEKKKKLKELQHKEKEILEKKRKEEYDKKYEAEQTFLAWKRRKEGVLKKENHLKKLEEDKYKTEEVEKDKNAESMMPPWKQMKDDKLIKKKKEVKKQVILDNEDKEREKHEAKLAYETWKAQKDAELKKRVLDRKKLAEEELRKQNEKIQKELEAIKAYEEWLEQKDKLYRQAKKERHLLKQSQTPHTDWSPTGKSYLVTYVRQKRCIT